MPTRDIQIQQLTINAYGVTPEVAQAALGSLGAALNQAVSAAALSHPISPRRSPPPGSAPYQPDAEQEVHLASASDSDALRRAVADQVARSVAAHLKPVPPRE